MDSYVLANAPWYGRVLRCVAVFWLLLCNDGLDELRRMLSIAPPHGAMYARKYGSR